MVILDDEDDDDDGGGGVLLQWTTVIFARDVLLFFLVFFILIETREGLFGTSFGTLSFVCLGFKRKKDHRMDPWDLYCPSYPCHS